jgi:hypothetical protein
MSKVLSACFFGKSPEKVAAVVPLVLAVTIRGDDFVRPIELYLDYLAGGWATRFSPRKRM